jgi:hypothetical protein
MIFVKSTRILDNKIRECINADYQVSLFFSTVFVFVSIKPETMNGSYKKEVRYGHSMKHTFLNVPIEILLHVAN